MADEKKETGRTTRRTTRASRTTKRPARTIDLEAKEVPEDAAKADEKATAAQDEKPAGDAKQPEKAPPAAGTKDADAKKTRTGGSADKAAAARSGAASRTTRVELRSFATHLAAGLIGGLIGVVVGGIGLSQLSSGDPEGAARTDQEIARLQSELGVLRNTLDEQKKAVEAAAKPAEVSKSDLGKIDARIAAVEKAASASASADAKETSGLSDRIGKLEDVLKAVQSSSGSETGDAATLELSSRLATLSDDVKAQREELDSEIAKLKGDVAKSGENTPTQAATDALDARTKALEAQIAKLTTEVQASQKAPLVAQDGGSGAALALAFEALRRAVVDGDPYAKQLDQFRSYAPESLDVSAISAYATTGVPRQRDLLKELPPLLRSAGEAADKADDETFLDRLATNAQAIVRVRRIGPVAGEGAAAVLSRIEAEMRASDLAGVLRETKSLKGPALDILKPWLAKAEMRQAAISALDSAERELLKKPATDSDAAAKR